MTDKELYKLCCEYGAKARMWKKKFVALLPEIAKRGLHKKHGFATIVEFAAKVGGVGKSTVERVFQVSKKIEDKPALKEILPEVGVHKLKAVVSIATKENQEDLAEKAKTMSKNALELFAKSQREEIRPGADREYLGFHVDKDVALELRKLKQKLGTVEWNDVMKTLLEKANEPAKKTRKSKSAKISRYIPAAKKREVGDECKFPGCNKPADVIHHPERFSLKSTHKRLVALCKSHHEIAHHGLIGNEEGDVNTWFIKEQANPKNPKYKIDQKVIQYKMAFT